MDRIGVVIPVPDRNEETARKCVDHLEKTQDFPHELILIEERGRNFSFGKSMNCGIREAKGDLIIGMDSDCFPEQNAIRNIVKFSQHFPNVGYFGVRIKTGRIWGLGWIYSNNPWHLLRQAILTPAPFFCFKKAMRQGLFAWDIRIINRFVLGMTGQATSFCLLRKQCWEDIGGFDESFRCSYSDVDLCYRILLSEKWHVSVCPHIRAWHIGHATTGAKEQCWVNSTMKDLYEKKWPHEKILEVVEASKRGKFVIPEAG